MFYFKLLFVWKLFSMKTCACGNQPIDFHCNGIVWLLYVTFCGFLNVTLFKNVWDYLDSKMSVNLVQYHSAVGVSNNRKFTKKLQYKEISKLKFIHTCFIADHLSLHNSMVSFFMLLIVFFLLKPKVLNGVKFSAFCYVLCGLYIFGISQMAI